MDDRESTYALFIDYDNLLLRQKNAGILDIVTQVLVRNALSPSSLRTLCDVRIYGGWYEGDQMTRLAQDISVQIQHDFPRIIPTRMVDGVPASIRTNAELAVALMEDPAHHLFSTYRRKGKPANIRIEEPESLGCHDQECPLLEMKKLLRTGGCPRTICKIAPTDVIYRHEQKIVDTMLSCDLIYAGVKNYDRVLLVSSDDDFLPPLRTLLLRGASIVRVHPKPSTQRQAMPWTGPSLLEWDL